ncbi:MAG TPA: cytochrome c oxidase accessory protein CcoG [Stellaceae bacterium]|nr:cytochrome c oxidase accessory protein CcoG [Stellaceae bacterium]
MTVEAREVAESGASRKQSLYQTRPKVYPRRVRGPIRRIKWVVLALCLTAYYVAPWLRWDRGPGRPDQAFLVDMPARRAYFLGLEIWPQEVYYIAGLLILGAIGLFFVTSLFGRLWCGFTCPQTVWTDLFMWAERLVEGDRMQRVRLDQQPWTLRKLGIKTAKHGIWLLIAAATGGAWIMYFNDAPTVTRNLLTLQASTTVYFFFGLFTATTYLLAGWAREQVCTFMCPWPRFQSAMVDEETLTVTYRGWRGEPRGRLHKGETFEGRGDCVDCHACVAVCPTGIDIRDGLQLECIGCGLCIDACNEIMDGVGRPHGLIAFDTALNRIAHERGTTAHPRLIRPRTIVYAAVMLIASGIMLAAVLNRATASIAVLAERSPLFVRLSDGSIRNSYVIKIENKTPAERSFVLSEEGLPFAMLQVAEGEGAAVPGGAGVILTVKPDSVGTFHAYLHLEKTAQPETPFKFIARATDGGETVAYVATFRGPGK